MSDAPAGNSRIGVLLADDHRLFRDALRTLLEQNGTLSVVAETGNGLEVLELARVTRPQVVCMDINMPGINGMEATRRLHQSCPETRIIAISAYSERRYITEMLEAGAQGYIHKVSAGDELLRAIVAVLGGAQYLCPTARSALEAARTDRGGLPDEATPDLLGAHERQLLQLMGEDRSMEEIAARLQMAESMVAAHQRNIMRKLGLNSIAKLAEYAADGRAAGK